MAVVRVKGHEGPVPLRSLGDGLERIFQLALALENAREAGLLLLDEVENGIHYSVFPDLWRFLMAGAVKHGVQVFATTHSWDCVEGFQSAAAGDPNNEPTLIRLYARGDDVRAVVLDGDELAIAARDRIEVR